LLRSKGGPSRSVPLGMLLTFVLLPLLTWLWVEQGVVTLTSVIVLLLIIIRRLTADLVRDLREKPVTESAAGILLNRFLYDRSYVEGYH